MKKKFLLSMAIMTASLSMILLFLVGAKTFLPASRMVFDFRDMFSALAYIVDKPSDKILDGDIYFTLFETPDLIIKIGDFRLKWSGFSEPQDATLVTTTTTATSTGGGTGTGNSGGFGGNADSNFDGYASTSNATTTNTVGELYLMKNQGEEVGLIKDFFKLSSLDDFNPLSFRLKSGEWFFSPRDINNSGLDRWFFEIRFNGQIATTSKFSVIEKKLIATTFPGGGFPRRWIKEGKQSFLTFYLFDKVPYSPGSLGRLFLVKVIDKESQTVNRKLIADNYPLDQRSVRWESLPDDFVTENDNGEYFFELEHPNGRVTSNVFRIADLNIVVSGADNFLAMGETYNITWRSAPGLTTGDLYLITNYGPMPISNVNMQEKSFSWTVPRDIAEQLKIGDRDKVEFYFQINSGDYVYVSRDFEVGVADVRIVPNCSLSDNNLTADEIKFCQYVSLSASNSEARSQKFEQDLVNIERKRWHFEEANNLKRPLPPYAPNSEQYRQITTRCLGPVTPLDVDFMSYTNGRNFRISDLNRLLWVLGYLPVAQDPSFYAVNNPKDPFNFIRHSAGKYTQGTYYSFIFDKQEDVNENTNNALKLLKYDFGLPLAQGGQSELDLETLKLIARISGCRYVEEPIMIDPPSYVDSQFLKSLKNRLDILWDRVVEIKTDLDNPSRLITTHPDGYVDRYGDRLSEDDKWLFAGYRGLWDGDLLQNPGFLERYRLPGYADAYSTPVNSCRDYSELKNISYPIEPIVGQQSPSFPYEFKRTNTCPYFSRGGFDHTAMLADWNYPYDDYKFKFEQLLIALRGMECISPDVSDIGSVTAGIKLLQTRNGLPPTGVIDTKTGLLLDSLWSIPGINTLNKPYTTWPYLVSAPLTFRKDGKDLFVNTKIITKTRFNGNARIDKDFYQGSTMFEPIYYQGLTEQFFCSSAGETNSNYNLVIESQNQYKNKPIPLFGIVRIVPNRPANSELSDLEWRQMNIEASEKWSNSNRGKDLSSAEKSKLSEIVQRHSGIQMLDSDSMGINLTWSSKNINHMQPIAVFLDKIVGKQNISIMVDTDLGIKNTGWYRLIMPKINRYPEAEGLYKVRFETTLNSSYYIKDDFVLNLIPDFTKELIDIASSSPWATPSFGWTFPELVDHDGFFRDTYTGSWLIKSGPDILFNLITRIVSALPPPPTYRVVADGPMLELKTETWMTLGEFLNYLDFLKSMDIDFDVSVDEIIERATY